SHPREKSGLQFLQGKAELLAKFVHDEKPLPVVFLADTTRSEDRLLVPSFSSPAPRALPPGAFTARATCPFNSYPHDPPQSGNAPVLLTHMQLAMGARQGTEAEDLTSTLVRLGARKLIEELLEAETSDILGGRGRYERRHAGQQGLRNGYKRRHIDCAEGRLEIEVPHIRGVQGVCQPALWAALQRRTDVLERLVVEMYVRGLSTRDIEDALQELGGEGVCLLSHASRQTP